MKKSNFTSKGQVQKFARSTLNSYQIDLSMLQVSCCTKSINLIGTLLGLDGEELSSEEISNLVTDLRSGGLVQSNLENWDLNGVSPRKIGKKSNNNDE
jgi:hypothetical protein